MSRLREILLANRDDPQLTAAELCPFCHNQNPQCQYFEAELVELSNPAEVEILRMDEPAEEAGDDPFPADAFWGRVRRMLAGTRITLTTKAGEVELDLGESMGKGFYYLDLLAPLDELPWVAKIARKFDIFAAEDGKTTKSASSRFVAMPAPVLQLGERLVLTWNNDMRETIDNALIPFISDVADEKSGEVVYRDCQWMPVYFDLSLPEITAFDSEVDNPNALALIDWRTIYGREEAIYRKWADLEERMRVEEPKIAEFKRAYPCSDLKKARQDVLLEWEELMAEAKTWLLD